MKRNHRQSTLDSLFSSAPKRTSVGSQGTSSTVEVIDLDASDSCFSSTQSCAGSEVITNARKNATQDADTSGGDGATMSAQNDLGSFWKYDMKEGFSTVGTVSEASGEWRVDPRQLSSKRKRELLKDHFKPARNFPFKS